VTNRINFFGIIALVIISMLAACAAPSAPAINVEGAWGRVSPSIAGSGAFYMMIKNTGSGEDKLTAVKSPACGMAEVHETVKNADGTMGMNLVPEPVTIPANGQVELKSGGMHVMCMMIKADQFISGNKVDLIMTFEKSGEKTVSVEIRDQ
jgi:copper(I)-binding protein